MQNLNVEKYRDAKERLMKAISLRTEGNRGKELDYLSSLEAEKFIEENYSTDFTKGLDLSEIAVRSQTYDSNVSQAIQAESKQTGLLRALWNASNNIFLRLLFVLSVLSIILNEVLEAENRSYGWIEGTVILIVITVPVLWQAKREYSKPKAFQALQALSELRKMATVIRNGTQFQISVSQIVPGDILIIKAGDSIPVDGFVLDAFSLIKPH